ncbi:MAG: hypothetical protein U9Q79_07405 [Candidatus Hydrogenedentes bacterium]|nr:hypothetical protein [Candidatus Hydrogenedentota bacterium]
MATMGALLPCGCLVASEAVNDDAGRGLESSIPSIPRRFKEYVRDNSEGMREHPASVLFPIRARDNLCGYMDKDGAVVFPPICNEVYYRSNAPCYLQEPNFAFWPVKPGELLWGFVDNRGAALIPPF